MPESFRFPDRNVDLWMPTTLRAVRARARQPLDTAPSAGSSPASRWSRRAPISASFKRRPPSSIRRPDRDVGVHVESLKETTVGNVRGSLWLLFGAVSVLLLIASTNIAALLLARAARRRQEISVRLSLGASTASIQARSSQKRPCWPFAGTALGLGLAVVGSRRSRRRSPDFPRIDEMAFDGGIAALRANVRRRRDVGLRRAAGDPQHARERRRIARPTRAGRRSSTRHSLQWCVRRHPGRAVGRACSRARGC